MLHHGAKIILAGSLGHAALDSKNGIHQIAFLGIINNLMVFVLIPGCNLTIYKGRSVMVVSFLWNRPATVKAHGIA